MAATGSATRTHRVALRLLQGCIVASLGALLLGCPPGYERINEPLANPSQTTPDGGTVSGINFAYPAYGQQDIVYKVQPVVIFPGSVSQATAQGDLQLVGPSGPVGMSFATPSVPAPDGSTQGVVVGTLTGAPEPSNPASTPSLAPDTTYQLVVSNGFSAGGVEFSKGTVLTTFTTRPRPGTAVTGGLTIVSHSPGNSASNGVANNMPYGVFAYNPQAGCQSNPPTPCNPQETPLTLNNTLHVSFSEPLDPATVVLGKSFTFTGPKGAVPGRLYAEGTQVSFQPTAPLTVGSTYTASFTADVKSLNGDALQAASFSVTPDSAGDIFREFLKIDPDPATDLASTAPSPLTGTPINVINVSSGLIGSNQAVSEDSALGQLVAYLGSTADTSNAFNQLKVTPLVIPAGTQLASASLHITLAKTVGGEGVNGQVSTGPLTITVLNNANGYMFNNPRRTDGLPTAMVLHMDMSMSGADAAGNAVLNQTVLNVTAVGVATPYEGKLYANAVVQIPLAIANTGVAIATLNLQLVLPANVADDPDGSKCHAGSIADGSCPAKVDTVAPVVTAFSPSTCFYSLGSGNGDSPAPPASVVRPSTIGFDSAAPWDTDANCAKPGPGTDGKPVTINGFPVNGRPFVVFTKPIDPQTLQTHDASHIDLTQGGTPVPFTAKVEGTSVVVTPDAPLKAATAYTLSVGTGLTDIVGNPLKTAETQTFSTKPYVTARPAPAFVTTINPGLPCALTGGDFLTGGNTAGYCTGDLGPDADASKRQVFGVFKMQANVPVTAYFTKPVKSATIVAANGCLTAGSGAQATNNPSFALESVDSSGQCTGVVPGGVLLAHPNAADTRWFEFTPLQPLTIGQRYWLVICGGASGSQCVAPHQIITDVDGLALNTTPTVNSGSLATKAVAATADMIEPFDAVVPTDNYSIVLQSQPDTDTNGNGHFDTGENPQTANGSTLSLALGSGSSAVPLPVPLNGYLSGDRPIQIQGLLYPDHPTEPIDGFPDFILSCANTPTPAGLDYIDPQTGQVQQHPSVCLPFILSAGGMFSLTSADINAKLVLDNLSLNTLNGIVAGLPLGGLSTALGNLTSALTNNGLTAALNSTLTQVTSAVGGVLNTLGLTDTSVLQTGRIMLRMTGTTLPDGTVVPYEVGYIVPECKGAFQDAAKTPFDFKPCIVTTLNLAANAPDSSGIKLNPAQQPVNTTAIGVVSFGNNGRMMTPLIGYTPVNLPVSVAGLPAMATVPSGALHIGLAGYPVHGDESVR
ncbi:MAG TPA: Ig-like domain-containing protein [Nevskiaceae bacterium]|nr:Ig-like domain-containing protein [Nevskiaceae bacterium]